MGEQTSAEILEELRDYNPDGTPKTRYWIGHDDMWWDIGFYFHCFILIGFWMLYDAVTTHHMTQTQFMLDHTITFFWVVCAGIYSGTAVVHDIIDAGKKRQKRLEESQ
jgi:hypothetical protein